MISFLNVTQPVKPRVYFVAPLIKPSRHIIRSFIALFCVAAMGVMATAIPAKADLTAEIVTAEDATGYRSEVRAFVTEHFAAIKSDNRELLSRSRDAIVNSAITSTPARSQSFLQLLSQEVDAQARPALASMSPAARLNTAIIVARLSRAGQASELQKTVELLIADQTPAISMWGLQAARSILPVILSDPLLKQNEKVIAAAAAAVQTHQEQGPVAAEAYRALLGEVEAITRDPARRQRNRELLAAIAPTLIDGAHDILGARIGIYATGAMPNDPMTDYSDGIRVLALPAVWSLQSAEQRETTMKRVLELLKVTRKNVDSTNAAQIDQFRELGRGLGSVCAAVDPSVPNAAALQKAGNDLNRVGRANSVQQIQTLIDNLIVAVPASFPNVLPGAKTGTTPAN